MHPALGPAFITFCTSLAMAVHVLARRHKDLFHWMLCGFLAGLAIWTAGVMVRFTTTSEAQLLASVKVAFVGVLLSSAFWLLTAVAYVGARAPAIQGHVSVAVLAVATLFAMALFTNEGHRLFLRRVDFVTVAAGPHAYVGPVFWVFLSWAYTCVGIGTLLYLRAARGMLRAESRRRGIALGLCCVFPVAASTIYVFQWLPVSYDLTPIGLVISMVILWVAVFRYRLFESLPLARDAVVTHLDDGVVMASAGGRITGWNPAAERLCGADGLRAGQRLGDALARLARTHDGRRVEVSLASVDSGHGDAAGQFAILSDRSDVDRIERLARQTQRLEIVGALAAEVAHEIADPLTFVRSNLVEIERLGSCVEAEGSGPDAELAVELRDLRAVAQETLEGVERIRRIVEDMRELAAGQRGGLEAVDLVRVTRDALRVARLDEAGIRVTVVCPPLPPVRGNADRLIQVVLNLLVNARQALATTPRPRVRITGRVHTGQVELSVHDNGPGIPDDLRHRVFDPFFTTRSPDEGTGLGLAIAFDIAREHDGVLEERPSEEGGACFVLRIPALPGDARAAGSSGAGREMQARLEH